jgi:hypothetical protein
MGFLVVNVEWRVFEEVVNGLLDEGFVFLLFTAGML